MNEIEGLKQQVQYLSERALVLVQEKEILTHDNNTIRRLLNEAEMEEAAAHAALDILEKKIGELEGRIGELSQAQKAGVNKK